MTILGILAGMLSGFWTRIIKLDMLFSFVGKWLNEKTHDHIVLTGRGEPAPISRFLRCVFCLTPWVCFLFDAFYIIEYTPFWIYALIGILGSLGAGNFVAETIFSIRNGE